MEKKEIVTLSDAEVTSNLVRIAGVKIFFGHQSVGKNILDGFADVPEALGVSVPVIRETRNAADMVSSGIYHSYVGKNTDPMSKLRDFESILRSGVGKSADIAFLKFCYVDIDAKTDVAALFLAYKETMARLRSEFPALALVHFTAPLTAEEQGVKASIKRFFGLRPAGDADNTVRAAYNAKIRAEYGGSAPVFDLALFESVSSDLPPDVRSSDRSGIPFLLAAYTDDGGHLNAAGRREIVRRLAVHLGNLSSAAIRKGE